MIIKTQVEFEFSGCDYHKKNPFGIEFGPEIGEAFLKEAGIENPTRYQSYIIRDLLLEYGREVVKGFSLLETKVRADVKARRGFEEWDGISQEALSFSKT